MSFLVPDKIITSKIGDEFVEIKQKIIPDGARAAKNICSYIKKGDLVKPNVRLNDGSGKPRGITIHNTDTISAAAGTNPAEQYSRATYPNGNMGGVVVHFYVFKSEIWQILDETEQGWHAADGATRSATARSCGVIGGNLDTIAIEIIESGADAETEETAAKLVGLLLAKHGLEPDDIYSHNYFCQTKKCPVYILPRWEEFKAKCEKYYGIIKKEEEKIGVVNFAPPASSIDAKNEENDLNCADNLSGAAASEAPTSAAAPENGALYRVQVGAFRVRANAENLLAKVKAAGFDAVVVLGER